jgi:hypothetical protein
MDLSLPRSGSITIGPFNILQPLPCDSVTKGDVFWSRYPTAGACRDNDSQACAEVCRLAFDESGGWMFSGATKKCDALFAQHYWPCLSSQ